MCTTCSTDMLQCGSPCPPPCDLPDLQVCALLMPASMQAQFPHCTAAGIKILLTLARTIMNRPKINGFHKGLAGAPGSHGVPSWARPIDSIAKLWLAIMYRLPYCNVP